MRATAYRIVAALFAIVSFVEGLDHALDSSAPHRIHVLGHTVMSTALVLGLLSQVFKSRVPAGLHLVGIIGVTAGLADVFGQRFGGLEAIVAVFLVVLLALHPERPAVFARREAVDTVALWTGLVLVAAVAPYFVHESALQRHVNNVANPEFGYYSWAAAAPLTMALAVLVASLRPRGWERLTVLASLGVLAFGVLSVVLPHEPGSWGIGYGIAGIAGAVVVGWTARRSRTLPSGERRLAPAA